MASELKSKLTDHRRDATALPASPLHDRADAGDRIGFIEPNEPDTPVAAAAPSRRVPRHDLREARQKLVHGRSSKPDFDYELLTTFARHERQALITIPTLAVISVFALMFWAPNQLSALGWCAMVIATKFFMTEHCRQFLNLPRAEVNVLDWRRRLTFLELVSGMSWGGMALVAATSSSDAAHVFVLAALIVLLAIRMTFASSVMSIFYAGTVPMTVAVFGRLLMQDDLFHYGMAFTAIGLQVYFVVLAKDLNATSIKLFASRAETEGLIAELEEQKSIADEARRRAESANVAKSRFLATMSHELRTPLNAILGFSEVMQSELFGPFDNPQYKDYIGNIHDSGRHLLHLINEILDLSRIEAGRYELNEEPVFLQDILEDSIRLLKLRAESKGLTMEPDVAPNLSQVWADERAVRQICLNLMSNAIKFTPRGGRIVLTIANTGDGGQRMIVKDNGPGIPKEEIPKVLQAFGQGSLAHQTAEGGTGLGLPIVSNLIELHGGSFELQSELRKGTSAIVNFPPARVLNAMPPLQPLGQERHKRPMSFRIIKPARDEPAPARVKRPPRLKGLVPESTTPEAAG